ncbi:DUF1016 N-terminal domain-containing protein, partial [Escherichia coli]
MESLSERTSTGYQQIHDGIIHLVDSARTETVRSVNALMTATYWEIGRRIVEFEQGGEARAAYGAQLIKRLSGNDSNLLIVFYVQIMPDDFVMQLHR